MSIFSSYWGRAIGICFIAIAMLAATPLALAQPPATNNVSFDIPAQNLATALTEFARQSNQELFYLPEMAEGKTTEGVTGTMSTTAAAMDTLLEGTGLEFEPTPNGSLLIGDRATLDARRAEWQSSAAGQQQQNTIGQRRPGIEEIIVTGQKREERIQDVPIAISAFSPEDLEAQKIEGGFDLLKGVPNVTFSKTNFTGYNFQIRGIGTQAVSATTDPGVAVSFNNTTLIVNRLFEQEYLDVERVEVLRGPQGTLFGRNATGGVINVISNKPEMGVWDGMIDVEVGNYNTRRLRGFFNAPLGDEFALRGAYASTQRDGFGLNEFNGNDVDNRDLWTGRLSLGWQPTDSFRANLIWERFEEDDQRVRTSKQLCHHDPGPEQVGSADVDQLETIYRVTILSQGCLPGSLYDTGEPGLSVDDPAGPAHGAYGTPNGASLPYVSGLFWGSFAGSTLGYPGVGHLGLNPYVDQRLFGSPSGLLVHPADPNPPCEAEAVFEGVTVLNLCNPDPYQRRGQSRDLRTISSVLEPQYEATSDIIEFSFDWDISPNLVFSSQTVYVEDEYFATQDFNRYQTFPLFNDSSQACGYGDVTVELFPGVPVTVPGADCSDDPDTGRGTFDGAAGVLDGGVFCDPQLGCSDLLVAQDISQSESTQYNQEFRLVSSFPGDWNFSLGANYTRFKTRNDYFVFANALTLLTNFFPFNWDAPLSSSPCLEDGLLCTSVDQKSLREVADDPQGHNFFLSDNPYKLTSEAVFGELYWQATDTIKFTAGLRFTWDQKVFTPVPSQLLLRDYRDFIEAGGINPPIVPGDGPEECVATGGNCELAGNASGGRGFPSNPDIIQKWREPTGRFVVDWQPLLDWTDETMLYASFSHGYKGGGANPPPIAPPSGLINIRNSGRAVPLTFEPEFINAYELGTKNTLFGGALVLNGTAFFYDYTDYQVSKIVDRQAANENFDAKVWGLELETIFAPSLNWQFNAAIGYLNTEIASGEESLNLMDRTQGGNRNFVLPEPIRIVERNDDGDIVSEIEHHEIDEWMVVKPWITSSSNCVVPVVVVETMINNIATTNENAELLGLCPGGNTFSTGVGGTGESSVGDVTIFYDPRTQAPNNAQGFNADLSGNELPNAPEFTVALGGQYNFDLTRDWRATARVDYYWQDESFARVYNTEYDRLKSWSNTNLSFWITNPVNGITVEAYVKNVFDETPITGTFLNSDDTGLTTNVFTLDPRLIGVSVRKEF